MKKLIERIAKDKSHASIPFWSWNDRLEEGELRRQIVNMKELGMRGFFMHARGGLETEYMSQDWFDCVRACIDEAKKQDMEAWAYDENGWPSGFAGGELLKDANNHAAYLVYEVVDSYPAPSDDIIGVYSVGQSGVTLLDGECGLSEYAVIRRKKDFSYVDVLNPVVTQQFIERTHEVYKAEVGDDFGKAMPGFFTDEPQYYRWGTPWSDTFLTVFNDRFGYDVKSGLPALFVDYDGACEFRYDYFTLLHECFMLNFAKPIHDWCEKSGAMLTGHAIEEWGLFGQMLCCGGIMPFYRYQQLPGIDYLGREVKDITGSKQLGSACEQLGRSVRLSEMFAMCGWDVSPRELKRIADVQFVGGVNMVCEHLYAYSERGQRKRDYPNHYSQHNPWQGEYKDFAAHYAHLGALLSQGQELADTLVIHPIHSAYLSFNRDDYGSIADLDSKFCQLATQLSFDQIPFHFGDETMLRDLGGVEGDAIRIGNCRYGKVVIPHCYTLDSNTVSVLKEYLANGGKLYMWGDCPDRIDGRKADLSFLESNITYAELKAASGIKASFEGDALPVYMQVRLTDEGRIFYFANPSDRIYKNAEITVENCSGLTLLDPMSLKTAPVRGEKNSNGSVSVLLDFGESASYVLIEQEGEFLPFEATMDKECITLDNPFKLVELPENMLLLDKAQISFDGKSFSKARPIVRIRDNLLRERYEGDVTLRFAFNAEFKPKNLFVVAEPMRYKSVSVNGHKVELIAQHGRFDRSFVGADIAAFVKEGENTVEMTFEYYQCEHVYDVLFGEGSESLRNCLVFDTEVEDVYLYGDFGVRSVGGFVDTDKPDTYRSRGDFALTERKDSIALDDIVRDGYPFFAGKMTVETDLYYNEGDPTLLRLFGRFAVCRVEVNGHSVESDIFSREFDLAPFIKQGKNILRLAVTFSNRNLLGPHHRTDAEPFSVGPNTFSFEKQWDDDSCPNFVEDLAFVKFGVRTE